MTIRLLLGDSLARAYKTIAVFASSSSCPGISGHEIRASGRGKVVQVNNSQLDASDNRNAIVSHSKPTAVTSRARVG
jgi:hypothetical protein